MIDASPVVLIADEKIQSRRSLRAGFELNGFIVHEAEWGGKAIHEATLRPVDIIVIDFALSDMDGGEVIKHIRSWSGVPIVVLSTQSGEQQKIHMLELGADDFIIKPFEMAELLARVRAILRRRTRSPSGDDSVTVGPLTIDFAGRAVFLNGKRVALTPKEYRLLQALAQDMGTVIAHRNLLTDVWGVVHAQDRHYLRILVRKLRQKIESSPGLPNILVTEVGVGYRLTPPIRGEDDGRELPAKTEF